MKILQIAPLITPDGAYGGPIRVALNQLRELAEMGHEVELVAGASGFGEILPTEIGHVPVKLFTVRQLVPKTGFAGLYAPGLGTYVKQQLKHVDIVHAHLARDLVTMPAALIVTRSSTPLVVQPHGMIIEPRNAMGRVFDAIFTRTILRNSDTIFTLTDSESASLASVAGPTLRLENIINGVPQHLGATSPRVKVDVLFLARLQERKRPQMFVQMASQLLSEGFDATFSLVGPDEGEGESVVQLIRDSGMGERIRWEGSLPPESTLDRIAASQVYVLPSVGEVFPMSVLEAMSVGSAIVVTSSNGLAAPLMKLNAALVTDETLDGLVTATRTLLGDPDLRALLGKNAREAAEAKYTMRSVASQLDATYSQHLVSR